MYFPPHLSFIFKILYPSISPLSVNLSHHFSLSSSEGHDLSLRHIYTQTHTDAHTEKIKKQHVSKRQCISPQSTEPRRWETKNKSTRPPSFHPLPPSCSPLKVCRLFICFIAFFFTPPDVFLFWLFSLRHIQCNDETYKKTCVSGKGRLVNDKCCSNVTVTVMLLDRVVFCIVRLPRYTQCQSNTYSILCTRCMNMHKRAISHNSNTHKYIQITQFNTVL